MFISREQRGDETPVVICIIILIYEWYNNIALVLRKEKKNRFSILYKKKRNPRR